MSHSPVHILYVDDDPVLVRLVEKACRRRGYRLAHAVTVEAALAALDQAEFSVVVLDHHLGAATGLDFLRATEDRAARPPVIYVTGSAETSVAVNALKMGAVDYVWKSAAGDFIDLLFGGIELAVERGRLEHAKARAEQEMREARDRAELLLSEVNHRIANSLSLVASLVRMQSSMVKDPGALAALSETQARIRAVAGVHRRLYRSTDVRQVALQDYVRELLDDLQTGFHAEGRPSEFACATDPVLASTDRAVTVGVVLTELVTNAVKYAYPPGQPGPIRVTLQATGENRARILVEDDGAGWTGEGEPQGSGLGTRIIRALLADLEGELTYRPVSAGTCAVFDFRPHSGLA